MTNGRRLLGHPFLLCAIIIGVIASWAQSEGRPESARHRANHGRACRTCLKLLTAEKAVLAQTDASRRP
jgi:hypothetical protein